MFLFFDGLLLVFGEFCVGGVDAGLEVLDSVGEGFVLDFELGN